ncbi:carboxylesterase family protein [Myxococcus sp. Y35]|uniref:carboxylesterase family protein n=1 Tax=Pseudomyxococcus flavus TaxID=3115648 RepID=UPI003CFB07C0
MGIPFATAGRFRRPTLLPFNPDLPYDQKGPAPLQAGNTSWLEADNGFGEDCLNLNVWAPEDAGDEPLPVVVYVFGGGWTLGANTQTTSNASGLAATGRVIGVSINYRLGPFGWRSLSQYGGRLAEASNLGLQDITTALQWVRENIARFGGDPGNVTGHSAGAFSALALLAAPSADGLYHHLAAFSGMPSRQVPAWGAEERAHAVLTALGIQDDPEQLLTVDAHVLAETMSKTQSPDPGAAHGVDNDVIAVVGDRDQPGSVLADHPMRVLESGRHRDVDILFSSTTGETDWWVDHRTEDFDPGTLADLIGEFSHRNRIPRSRARKIIATFDTDGRSPIRVRSALLTNYSFTLPQVRGALAHAAAGGRAHLLAIGRLPGAPAVHGTEMHGIVGQKRPGASDEILARDTAVRHALLALATGHTNELWEPVTTEPTTKGLGDMPYDATTHAKNMLETFTGIDRP